MSEELGPYITLGDIAAELRIMRKDGMTKESIEYALDRVFEEPVVLGQRTELMFRPRTVDDPQETDR